MTFKMMVLAAAALIAAAALYRAAETGVWRRWLAPEPAAPKPVVFDNGTVRGWEPASSPAGRQPVVPGAVRKCKRGAEVVYTNGECPPGTREQAMQGGTLTVVGGAGVAPAVPPRPAGSAARPSTVRDLVDLSDVERIKERRIEEAMRR